MRISTWGRGKAMKPRSCNSRLPAGKGYGVASASRLSWMRPPTVSLRNRMMQGNRTSDLGEELCEIGVLPTGPFDFDTQGALGGFLGQEIKGHMAQDGEVMWAVIAAVSGIVLIHNHVQEPMQVVFDHPMGPRRVPESFRRQRRAEQVIGRVPSGFAPECTKTAMSSVSLSCGKHHIG